MVLSWCALSIRFLSFIAVWPIVLRNFSPAEIAVWGVLGVLIGLQPLLESAFSDTFCRVIAHAKGGRVEFSYEGLSSVKENNEQRRSEPNLAAISSLRTLMMRIYLVLALFFLVAGGIAACLIMNRPVSNLLDSNLELHAWIATGVTVVGSAIGLFSNQFSALANGMHWVVDVKRIEAGAALGGLITSLLVILFGGRVLALVIATQSWVCIASILMGLMVFNRLRTIPGSRTFNWNLLWQIWPGTWRSWLGVVVSMAVVQATPLIYSQDPDAKRVAEFLFSYRLLSFLVSLSLPPFYTKLPMMASQIAAGREGAAVHLAKRRMGFSLWTFALGFLSIGLFGPTALDLMHSKIDFVSSNIWMLFGCGFFLERVGGMHAQLFSQTGIVKWHIGNSINGTIYLLISLFLYSHFNIEALGVAMILSNLLFFVPFSLTQSYKRFGLTLLGFELEASILPLLAILLFFPLARLIERSF